MDDKTAYQILDIKPGTSRQEISARFNNFTKIYKHYLMGEKIVISPDQLEQMRLAYIHLLYKPIEDRELADLFPQDENSILRQIREKIVSPLWKRFRPQIIYTVTMAILTWLTILLLNYKPIDLRVTILAPHYDTFQQYQISSLRINALEHELPGIISTIDRPSIEHRDYHPSSNPEALGIMIYGGSDVLIMKEELFKKLINSGFTFLPLESLLPQESKSKAEAYRYGYTGLCLTINKDADIYNKICNLQGDDESWIAAVPVDAKHLKEALKFIDFLACPSLQITTSRN